MKQSIRARFRGRGGERGSVITTLAFATVLVLGMVVAALVLGRQAVARRDLQTAADAAALACAFSVQQNGLRSWIVRNPLDYQTYLPKNSYLPRFRAGCTTFPWNNLHGIYKQNRHLVTAMVTSRLDTEQSWFSRYIDLTAHSSAQVNEMVFGDKWPVVLFLLDASDSMTENLLGNSSKKAYELLKEVLTEYGTNTFPVRNGAILYNEKLINVGLPARTKNFNKGSFLTALNTSLMSMDGKKSDARLGFRETNKVFTRAYDGGNNVVFISDGEPTMLSGVKCTGTDTRCFTEPEKESRKTRNTYQANVYGMELRRTNYTARATAFMENVAGWPNKPNGVKGPVYQVSSAAGIRSFLIMLVEQICGFTITPREGAAPDLYRPRRGNTRLNGPPRRIFAYIRDEMTGNETAIPWVSNARMAFARPGFQYAVHARTGASMVFLTQTACNTMGANPNHRLVVRWDDPQLVSR